MSSQMTNPRLLKGSERITYICMVMKMRARGRAAMIEADRKRRHKRMKKSSKDWHRHIGLIEDKDFGMKPPRMTMMEAKVRL